MDKDEVVEPRLKDDVSEKNEDYMMVVDGMIYRQLEVETDQGKVEEL